MTHLAAVDTGFVSLRPDLPARAQVRVVHETHPGGQGTTLSAQFWASDPLVPHQETMREGDCRLLEYEPQQCPDGCWDGVCQDGECVPYPLLQSAGTVRVTCMPDEATLQYVSGYYYACSEDPATAGAVLHASGAVELRIEDVVTFYVVHE